MVVDEVKPDAATALQGVKLYAQHLQSEASKVRGKTLRCTSRLVLTLDYCYSKGTATQDVLFNWECTSVGFRSRAVARVACRPRGQRQPIPASHGRLHLHARRRSCRSHEDCSLHFHSRTICNPGTHEKASLDTSARTEWYEGFCCALDSKPMWL